MTTKKIDIATEIFKSNKDAERGTVIEKIMKKLSVTRGNASIYYAKAKDRSEKEGGAKAGGKKEQTPATASAKKDDKPEGDSGSTKPEGAPSGKYANTKIREVITTAIEESDRSAMPAFLRASWEKHNF